MPDPFRKVSPGESVVLQAETWNAILDAAQAEKLRKHSSLSEPSQSVRQGTIIRILNASGLDLVRNSVLGILEPIFPPSSSEDAFQSEVLLKGVIPTTSHKGKFAVTIDPLVAGGIGRAHVDGVSPVKVDILDPAHKCCDVDPGNTNHLISMPSGASSQILWSEGTVGEQWGIVRIASPSCACGTIVVTVRQCVGNALISGALVTVKDSGGSTVGSATTGASGVVTIPIPSAATYSIIVSKTGEVTTTVSIVATCAVNTQTVFLGSAAPWKVLSCGRNLPGATVTMTLAGATYSGVTDASGNCDVAISGTGVYNYTISYPSRLQSVSGTRSILSCFPNRQSITLPPIVTAGVPDYVCLLGFTCPLPMPRTLYLTDSAYGSFTLTYRPFVSDPHQWSYQATINYPGGGSHACPPEPALRVHYLFDLDIGLGSNRNLRLQYGSFSSANPLCPGSALAGNTLDATANPGYGCNPLFVQFTITNDYFYPGGPATITVTE